VGNTERGMASWYGKRYDGRPAAYGAAKIVLRAGGERTERRGGGGAGGAVVEEARRSQAFVVRLDP